MPRDDGDYGTDHENTGAMLFRHELRPEWGNAIAIWERDEKRGYQFEDGQLRVFKLGYYDRLVVATTPPEESAKIIAALRRRAGWKEPARTKTKTKEVKAVPVDQQIALFAKLYPEGFGGAKWAADKRGTDTTRRLKRHREASILEAGKLLSKDRLESLGGVGKHDTIVESLREICNGTDLITKTHVQVLDGLDEAGAQKVSEGLMDLLHGDAADGIRFERFVDALARIIGKRPTWQLATIFPALFHPADHICIKPGAMRTQVACAGRPVKISASPDAPTYQKLRDLALAVRDQLVEAGHEPRDLVDVYEFIAVTTTAKALRQMHADAGDGLAAA